MKKIFFFILAFYASALMLNAQGMYDALTFSDQNYYGTARSMALGNAMTAIGGDIGSITLNPAGSAVMSSSQLAFTPGIVHSMSETSYTPVAGGILSNTTYQKGNRAAMPSSGVVFRFDTYAGGALKAFTFGLVSNTSNNYLSRSSVMGTNDYYSMTGALAVGANGLSLPSDVLDDYDSYYKYNSSSWPYFLARQANLVESYDDFNYKYAGAAENIRYDKAKDVYSVYLGGPITQTYRRNETGYKKDVVFNFGFNLWDKLFLGVNLGIPYMVYDMVDYVQEDAQNSEDFDLGFVSMSYKYSYSARSTGIYGRIGAIWLPIAGLRIGASVQTPTSYRVRDVYQIVASSSFEYDMHEGRSAYTPSDDFQYRFISPTIMNFGVAYTIGQFGFISVDWERTFYNQMYFREIDSSSITDYFYYSNKDIKDFLMPADMFRVGAEIRIIPEFAIRGGYTYKNTPECYYWNGVKERDKGTTTGWSVGIGYSSPRNFFADFAFRSTKFTDVYRQPYAGMYDETGYSIPSMEILSSRQILDFALTLGWRF